MIQTFATSETENFFATGKSRRLPTEILKRTAMRLNQVHAATKIETLRLPPSNHLKKLTGDRMTNGVLVLTGSGGFVFGSKEGMPSMLKSWTTTKKMNYHNF